jgi:hypothetical protein
VSVDGSELHSGGGEYAMFRVKANPAILSTRAKIHLDHQRHTGERDECRHTADCCRYP